MQSAANRINLAGSICTCRVVPVVHAEPLAPLTDCLGWPLGGSSEALRRPVFVAMVMRYFRREDSQVSVGVHQSALRRYDDEFDAQFGWPCGATL
jgi:hypothetical protein